MTDVVTEALGDGITELLGVTELLSVTELLGVTEMLGDSDRETVGLAEAAVRKTTRFA